MKRRKNRLHILDAALIAALSLFAQISLNETYGYEICWWREAANSDCICSRCQWPRFRVSASHLNIWLPDQVLTMVSVLVYRVSKLQRSPQKITVIIKTKPATYPAAAAGSSVSQLKPFTEMIKPSPSALPCPLPRLRSLGMLSEYLAFFDFTSSLLSRN